MADESGNKPEASESEVGRNFRTAVGEKIESADRQSLGTKWIQGIAAVATIISFGLAVASILQWLPDHSRDTQEQLVVRVTELDKRLLALERNVTKLKQHGRQAGAPSQVSLNEEAAQRLSILEGAVLDNPEKALNLVLVRREVNELRSAIVTSESTSQREISRVYDLTKLAVAAIFGMVLGVLGLVLTQLLPRKHLPVQDQHQKQ